MTTYQFKTNSNAAPFCSDTYSGFINADTPMDALRMVVKYYSHPAGLYSATIHECSPENKLLARFLSSKANTSVKAGAGVHQYKAGELYVNDVKAPVLPEVYEEL